MEALVLVPALVFLSLAAAPLARPRVARRAWLLAASCMPAVLLGLAGPAPAPAQAPSDQREYLYCPECSLEMPCPPGRENADVLCPRCGGKKIVMEHSAARHSAPGWKAVGKDWLATALIVLGVVLAALWGVLRLWRGPAPVSVTEVFFEVPCPTCRRSVRFLQRQAGQKGGCTFCGASCVFPDPTSDAKGFFKKPSVKQWAKDMRRLPRRKKGPA
jgi:hypothetical protein